MSVCKGAAILWYSKIGRQREAHAAMGLAGRSDDGRRSLVIMPAPMHSQSCIYSIASMNVSSKKLQGHRRFAL